MVHRQIKMGEVLKSLYENGNFTQTSLANKLGIRQSTLNGYFYGVMPRGLESIVRIANHLEISLDELVFGSSNNSLKPIELKPESLIEGKYEVIIQKKIKE